MMLRMRHDGDIYILAMTDYDPAGYDIANTFKNQFEEFLPVLGQEAKVHIGRVGIRPDQLSEDEVLNNKYTPKGEGKAQGERWMKATGGIDGEYKGLELDALPPDRIRGLFATSLKKYVDPKQYAEFVKQSYIRKLVLQTAQDKIDDIVADAISSEMTAIDLYDFDIFELAREGRRIVPVNELCSGNRDLAIHELTMMAFAS